MNTFTKLCSYEYIDCIKGLYLFHSVEVRALLNDCTVGLSAHLAA